VLVCQNIVVDKLAIVIINRNLSIANLIEKGPSGPVGGWGGGSEGVLNLFPSVQSTTYK
jgi:hypothetical protein